MTLPQTPRPVRRAALLAAALLLGACGDSGTSSEPVDRVEISAPASSLEEGATLQLTVTARGASGKALPRRRATWTSSNPAVAEVSGSGEVRGRTIGTSTITADVDGKLATADVQVLAATVASVAVQATSVPALTTAPLQMQPRDARGNALLGRTATWQVADSTIARVSPQGTVTGRRLGSTTVSATVEGKTGSAQLTVTRSTVNFTVSSVHVNQGSQTLAGSIPLIAGRDGWLRVFAVASIANEGSPRMRVRLLQNGAEVSSTTLPLQATSVGTTLNQGSLASTWNLRVPGALVRPGLAVQVEVNPGGELSEANTSDNVFPAAGAQPFNVQTSYPHRQVFVPVHSPASGLTGRMTAGDTARFMSLFRRIFPVPAVESTVRETFTSAAPALQPGNENDGWGITLSEINALRVADGSSAYYYGVVRLPYTSGGIAGLGYVPGEAAIGYDTQTGGPIIFTHEMGHNFNRQHAPCGGASGADVQYPHPGATLGSPGMDIVSGDLKPASLRDIMSYCYEWVSDYTFRAIADYRASLGGTAQQLAAGGVPTRSLLVWGRIGNGRATLEPAFEITARPALPARPGPHAVEALDAAGNRLFTLSFAAGEVADLPGREGHFAFSVPVSEADADRIATLRLTADGRRVERRATPAPRLSRTGVAADDGASLRRVGNGVGVRWDAARFPMVMMRDAATGRVLGFGRGGDAAVAARAGGEVELVLSDGVRSQRRRLRVPAQ